jgi:hypothetical protein
MKVVHKNHMTSRTIPVAIRLKYCPGYGRSLPMKLVMSRVRQIPRPPTDQFLPPKNLMTHLQLKKLISYLS